MKILKATKTNIHQAMQVLRRGGVIVYPTETAYALGCDATNARAVAKIFRLKGRAGIKTLPLIVASKIMANAMVKNAPIGAFLTARFWPGPLTVVCNARVYPAHAKRGTSPRATRRLATGVVAPDDTIAIRVSGSRVARALSQGLGRPIVATSANRAGDPPTYTVKDALKGLGGTPDLVLDAGRLPRRKPSTIIKIVRGKIKILRQGGIHVQSHL